MNMSQVVLRNLCTNSDYAQEVLPFIKPEYFEVPTERSVFEATAEFITNYHNLPSPEAMKVSLSNRVNGPDLTECQTLVTNLFDVQATPTPYDWLLAETEKWVQERDLLVSLYDCMDRIEADKAKGTTTRQDIPGILSKSLSISFDQHIGHNFMEQSTERFQWYHQKDARLPTNLQWFDLILGGGWKRKTLNVIFALTGTGKTLAMCHFAARAFLQNKNVLYITLEISEKDVAKRIDANLLKLTMEDIENIPETVYTSRLERLKQKAPLANLVIKEYPSGSGHVGHFRHLLHELKLKRNFVPDLVCVDYLGICARARFSAAAAGKNMYGYYRSIAQELRGLAMEQDLPILTGIQTNRQGVDNDDPDMSNIAESFGTVMEADFFAAMVKTQALQQVNQIMFKQLKNRYRAMENEIGTLGIDTRKMTLYDVGTATPTLVPSKSFV